MCQKMFYWSVKISKTLLNANTSCLRCVRIPETQFDKSNLDPHLEYNRLTHPPLSKGVQNRLAHWRLITHFQCLHVTLQQRVSIGWPDPKGYSSGSRSSGWLGWKLDLSHLLYRKPSFLKENSEFNRLHEKSTENACALMMTFCRTMTLGACTFIIIVSLRESFASLCLL